MRWDQGRPTAIMPTSSGAKLASTYGRLEPSCRSIRRVRTPAADSPGLAADDVERDLPKVQDIAEAGSR
jgi:hypothetical protein